VHIQEPPKRQRQGKVAFPGSAWPAQVSEDPACQTRSPTASSVTGRRFPKDVLVRKAIAGNLAYIFQFGELRKQVKLRTPNDHLFPDSAPTVLRNLRSFGKRDDPVRSPWMGGIIDNTKRPGRDEFKNGGQN